MRIRKVRFKNLNSLLGEWEIDFDKLAPDGIFAITGPTGAGKTTILDAVCLALYGCTPRLAKVTDKWNEIMSRGAGECYAEATIETKTGRFRCHWSQHRAYKKPTGALSNPKHELTDDNTGKIVQEKIRGVAAEIERVTGMDFNQFTRSMLLAQGDFDKFLQAPPDQRSPILEQITGTEIYTQISKRVHERRVAERSELEKLQAEFAGIPILSPEEAQWLREDLERKRLEEATLGGLVDKTNASIKWLEGLERLEDDLKRLEAERHELRTRQEAFAPQREKLGRANRALELAGEYAALTSIRQQQRIDQGDLREHLEELPAREEAKNHADTVMAKSVERLDAMKAGLQKALPDIRKAQEMDLKIREKDNPIKAAQANLSALEKRRNTLASKQRNDCEELEADRARLQATLDDLEESKADERLVQDLTGIAGRFDVIKEIDDRRNAKMKEISAAQNQHEKLERQRKKRAANLESTSRERAQSEEALTKKQGELVVALEGNDIAFWREKLSAATERRYFLDKARAAAETLADSRGKLNNLRATGMNLERKKTTLAEDINARHEARSRLEKEVEELEALFTAQKTIRDFDEARSRLQDGAPCPLCGSLDHPYARGNIPVPDETKRRLRTARQNLKAAVKAVSDIEVEWAKLEKDIDQVSTGIAEQNDKIEKSKQFVNIDCSALQLDADDPDLVRKLDDLRDGAENESARVTGILRVAESLGTSISELIKTCDKAKDKLAKAEMDAQKASDQRDFASAQIDRLGKEAEALQSEIEKSLSAAQSEISAYGPEISATPDKFDAILKDLTGRRDRWTSLQKKQSEIERKIAELEVRTRHQAESIRQLEEETGQQRAGLDELLRLREALIGERREVFGDKNPDQEERRLSAEIEKAEKALVLARAKRDDASQKIVALISAIEAQQKSISARIPQIEALEESFAKRLRALDFVDEADFNTALAPDDERNQLDQEARGLDDAETALNSVQGEKKALWEDERSKRVTDQPLEGLRRALTTQETQRKELLQAMGGIDRKLADNDNLQKERGKKAAEVERQKAECGRWDRLHELIGSSDGKKYRNFAQGLTFELLIARANAQLSKMTDRYELIRDHAHALELNVIDRYQAAEVRSTKNLSGGESFIVSLALALGLSHMVGAKVPVDSLFLDEGFGTLDEDVLDTALQTLAGLQRENKLIGVISHVVALQERIAAQIRVVPLSGGKSRIEGTGVRAI